MFGHQYYHGTIRKYVIAFGSLFSDIIVQRLDTNGNRIQSIAVPIAYGPKEKFLVRLRHDPDLEQDVAVTLPRIGFEIISMQYNGQRKLSSTHKNVMIYDDDGDRVQTQFVPVPYDINMQLSIFSKNADDASQIIESILPYFRPEFTLNVNLIPEMGIVVDTPVVLQSVSIEDTYEGDFDTRRALVHTLDFIVKGTFYGPIVTSGLIKRAIIGISDQDTLDPTIERITVTPSQYANGAPLFSPSANASLSVLTSAINANTDYGFTTDIEIDPFNIENS